MSDTSSSATDSPAPKPSRLRKWGIRFLKTLGVLVALLALVHAEEYWRGNRAYTRALADWKAAGLPTAEEFFKDDPIVPPEKNLLDAPFFSMWKTTNTADKTSRDARLEKWYRLMAIPFPGNAPSFDTNWNRLFTSTSNQYPGLASVPGQSNAVTLIGAVESDFPEIKTVVESERTRTEISFGYKWPAPERIFIDGQIPSFRAIRDSSVPLTLHAGAKLETGDGASALAVIRSSLQVEQVMARNEMLVGVMIASVHATLAPIRLIHEGLSRSVWTEDDLHSIEPLLSGYRPLSGIHRSLVGEALAGSALVNGTRQGDIAKLFMWSGESENPSLTYAAYLIPRGWLKLNAATHLDTMREILAHDAHTTGRVDFGPNKAIARRLAESTFSPGSFIARLAIPAFAKVTATSARNQVRLDCCRIGIALERHRLKTGAFPETLDALAPGFIAKVPTGPVTGLAPAYAKNTDGGYTLNYKGEDLFDSDLSLDAPPPVGKDIIWTMPLPKAR